jgi:hypothetical protein
VTAGGRRTAWIAARSRSAARIAAWSRSAAWIAARIWSLPNTLAGLAFALAAAPFGARLVRAGGALAALGHPWVRRRFAITLGHVVCYGRGCGPATPLGAGVTLADHERQHVRQSERLGPLYLPAHAWYGLLALARDGRWHGPSNRLERGPLATPPRPWG